MLKEHCFHLIRRNSILKSNSVWKSLDKAQMKNRQFDFSHLSAQQFSLSAPPPSCHFTFRRTPASSLSPKPPQQQPACVTNTSHINITSHSRQVAFSAWGLYVLVSRDVSVSSISDSYVRCRASAWPHQLPLGYSFQSHAACSSLLY